MTFHFNIIEGNTVRVTFPYSPEAVEKVKQFSSRSWNQDLKCWEIPLRIVNEIPRVLNVEIPQNIKSAYEHVFVPKPVIFNPSLLRPEIKLYPFQIEGIEFLATHKNALLADEVGCLDGDTIISINKRNKNGYKSFKLKLSELYIRFNDINIKGKRKSWKNSTIFTRSLVSDGSIKTNKIISVFEKGQKETIKIFTKSGKELILTPEHEILTPNGFVEAQKLKENDIVLTNRTQLCTLCKSDKNIITYKYAKFRGYCKECMYRQLRENNLSYKRNISQDCIYIQGGLKYHPYSNGTDMPEHRLIYEAHINNLTLMEWLEKLRINNIEGYKFIDPKMDIHHKNGNPFDNRIENLELVSRSKHHIIHNKYSNFGGICIPKEDAILKIEYSGIRNVYDIIMDEPSRNFVANGIIVHNCGKTPQSISTALHLNCNKILIICPASVKRQWNREIQKFTNKTCTIIDGKSKQREQQYKEDSMFFIVNYELVMKDLPWINMRTWDMVIADEVSRIKNWKSKTKSAILQVKTNFKLALTATPIENSIQELHSILSWINPDILGTYWNFINEYCYFCTNLYGGYTITGIKDAKKLHEVLKSVMIRRKKIEVYTELPEIIHNEYYIPLTMTQQKMYKEINDNIMNLVQKEEMDEGVLNQIMYLRELCNSPRLLNPDLMENGKVPEVVEIVKQFSSEHKILIFSQWTKFLDLLAEEFSKNNINFVSLRGDISQEVREENIIKFNTDPEMRVFLLSDAGNSGLNLQSADVVVHCDLVWNPAKMTQRNGRAHRIGQQNRVNVITILTEDTIEEKVYSLLKSKSDLFNQIIEDEQNIKFNKDMIRKIFKEKS
jgi:SNF2 family DNA or RNA helicase